MKVTRSWDYASRLLPGAPIPSIDALADALQFEFPGVVRMISRHVNREIRRVAKRRKKVSA